MAKTDFKSVDEYIASQPEVVQGVLKRVRNAIRKALPRAEEAISYQIPAYKLDGRLRLRFECEMTLQRINGCLTHRVSAAAARGRAAAAGCKLRQSAPGDPRQRSTPTIGTGHQ